MGAEDIRQEIQDLRHRIDVLEREVAPDSRSNCDGHCSTVAPSRSYETSHRGELLGAVAGALGRARATIDGTRSDNGFLGCVEARYRATINTDVYIHWSTAQAFSNLRAGSADWSVIVGHGSPGLIVNGTGQIVDGPDKYMSAANEANWGPYASLGVPGTRLVLFGCEVASGADGANFLRRVANRVRKEVGAWTGLVWCDSTHVWGTGNFVVVAPGGRIEPVDAPVMYEGDAKMDTLQLQSFDGYEHVSFGSITAVNFTPIGSVPQQNKAVNFDGRGGSELLHAFDFANPLVTDDKPASIITGQLTITYHPNPNEIRVRSFRLLGYSLLQDCLFQNTYYYASSPKLRDILTRASV